MQQEFTKLSKREQEIERRVRNKLAYKVIKQEMVDRVVEASEKKTLLPPRTGFGMMDRMLVQLAKQDPYGMAQWFIELREALTVKLYEEQGYDLEEEVEEEMTREEEEYGEYSVHS